MQTPAFAATVLLALFACKLLNKEDKQAAGAGSAAVSSAAASAGATAPVSPGESPLSPHEWAAGQWTRHRMTLNGTESTLTYKVLKQDGDDYLLEVVTKNKAHPQGTILQITMTMKSLKDPRGSQIKGAKIKLPGGAVQEFKGALLGPMQSMYKGLLGIVNVPDVRSLPREDVTVAAGQFKGCFKHANPPSFAGMSTKGTSYVHFSVPISGIVKTLGPDGKTQMELLEYGFTGAKSEM